MTQILERNVQQILEASPEQVLRTFEEIIAFNGLQAGGGGRGNYKPPDHGGDDWNHNEGDPDPYNRSRGIFGRLGESVLLFVLREPWKRVLNEDISPAMSSYPKKPKN